MQESKPEVLSTADFGFLSGIVVVIVHDSSADMFDAGLATLGSKIIT